jgi:hypothetical protein
VSALLLCSNASGVRAPLPAFRCAVLFFPMAQVKRSHAPRRLSHAPPNGARILRLRGADRIQFGQV